MKKVLFFLFAVSFWTVSGQGNGSSEIEIISHQVQQGETIRLLSLKYLATPSDIYKLNKFAIDGIRQGMVLQIPVRKKYNITETIAIPEQKQDDRDADTGAVNDSSQALSEQIIPTTHSVAQGETLMGISRLYGVTISELKNENQSLMARGLQSGQVLKIPKKSEDSHASYTEVENTATQKNSKSEVSSSEFIVHTVEPKETLYSISRKYNVAVDVLKDNNEKLLAQGLKAGQVIKIKPNN